MSDPDDDPDVISMWSGEKLKFVQQFVAQDGPCMRLICPSCGCFEVHLGPVSVRQGKTETIVKREISAELEHPVAAGRGSTITISCFCEAGCRFELSLAFHKGSSCFDWLLLPDSKDETEEEEELWRD